MANQSGIAGRRSRDAKQSSAAHRSNGLSSCTGRGGLAAKSFESWADDKLGLPQSKAKRCMLPNYPRILANYLPMIGR